MTLATQSPNASIVYAITGGSAPTLESSHHFCRDITRREARNFYYGLKLLPEPKRSAMYALYAYMRLVDDIADDDETLTLEQRHADLTQWESQTHQVISAVSSGAALPSIHPLWPAFAEMIRTYQIPAKVFDDMIAGQRQDLHPISIPDFPALREYCYRVASVVGVASLYVFGFEGGHETLQLGVDRGIAFQLTNILRDLREDAARGRCYLPQDEMVKFNVSSQEIAAGNPPVSAFADMMAFQIERAREFFLRSAPLDKLVHADARPTLTTMTAIYRAILERIADNPRRTLRRRVSLSPLTKFRLAWSALRSR